MPWRWRAGRLALVHDPRAGTVHGHRDLRRFVRRNQVWLAERCARIEMVAATGVEGRAVVERQQRTGERDENWPAWYAEYMVAEQAGTPLPT